MNTILFLLLPAIPAQIVPPSISFYGDGGSNFYQIFQNQPAPISSRYTIEPISSFKPLEAPRKGATGRFRITFTDEGGTPYVYCGTFYEEYEGYDDVLVQVSLHADQFEGN